MYHKPYLTQIANFRNYGPDFQAKSETPKTDIYFTLDGSKPEPFAPLGSGRSTFKYNKVFSLPPGKQRVTIKAVAVTFDGLRESNMVTRTYQIKQTGDENNNETAGAMKNGVFSTFSNQRSAQWPIRKPSAKAYSGVFGSLPGSVPNSENVSRSANSAVPNPLLVASLICTTCCAPRSKYGKSKYCSECGTMYPDMKGKASPGIKRRGTQNTSAKSKLGTMGICLNCKAYVPLNSSSCLVCDAELKGQLPGKTSSSVKLECPSCKTMNTSNATSCTVCEHSLGTAKQISGPQRPPVDLTLNTSPNTKKCIACRTMNPSDAVFCGTCGKKQETPSESACPQCQSQVPKGSKFCLTCGALYLQTSSPKKIKEELPVPINQFSAKPDARAMMQMEIANAMTKKDVASSTVIPSAITPPPVINPVASQKSPGGGYWRKQLDHIASHLKLYAQSHKDFQHDVAEFKIGKMVGATVDCSESDGVFRLCLDFLLVEQNDKTSNKSVQSRFLESADAKSQAARRSRRDAFETKNDGKKRPSSVTNRQNSKPSSVRRTRSSTPGGRTSKLTPESEDLLKEIQIDKDLDEIQKLLASGADSNLKNGEGVPVLVLAVRQFFQEAIEPLVEAGADLNAQFGIRNNSALHEAVLLGPAGKNTVLSLLKCGANAELENKQGETAQGLAIKHGYHDMADIIAAHLSQKLLSNL